MFSNLKRLTFAVALMILVSGSPAVAANDDLPDVQYYGYKIVHHMTAVVKHIEEYSFNTFDHPRIADYRSFVITPALDHFYSKAVADLRFGPAVIDTPAKDDRYSSLEIFDHEHYAIFDKLLGRESERFVLIREDYKGKLPAGTVIKTKSNFPLVFIRTQSFAFNEDDLANAIRHQARMTSVWEPVELPTVSDTLALLRWSSANSLPYESTKNLVSESARTYTPAVHKATFENLKAFLASGGVSGNVGMFEPCGHPAGGTHKVRAAGTLLGHLGFPVHHAYYQQIPMDRTGKPLAGANGPFVVTIPHKPGVDLFWSVTRYGADTFRPLNPADLGGNDIQAYSGFNTKPDADGNVTFTFSIEDPKDGTYWMPVKATGYYLIFRYYGPTARLNGNTAKDLVYGGTKLAARFKAVKFN